MECILGTVELLEAVLFQLDNKTLLTSANRVSRDWNDLIETSPLLQEKLFFRLRPGAASNNPDDDARPHVSVNPLLRTHINKLLQASRTAPTGQASWRNMMLASPGLLRLGVWVVDMGSHLAQGFANSAMTWTCARRGDQKNAVYWRMEDVVGLSGDLPGPVADRYTWTIFGREEGSEHFEKEKNSLLIRKARMDEQRDLRRMWETADVIVKVTKWHDPRRESLGEP